MGSGSNSVPMHLYCSCHENQTMALFSPQTGIEIMGRHHGTMHIISLSVRDLLKQMAGTIEGSAIVEFVKITVMSG